jgi:hypothetical protein
MEVYIYRIPIHTRRGKISMTTGLKQKTRYLDQDWLQDVYLQQLHSILRYIRTKNVIASNF